MRLADLEASPYKIHDLSRPKVQQLEFVVTFLDLTVSDLGQSTPRANADFMFMLYITLGE
jgi:hypothetical protein